MPYKDKGAQRDYQRQYHRELRAGGHYSAKNKDKTSKTLFSNHYRLKKAKDFLHILEDAINAVWEDGTITGLQRARTLGYLVGVGIRVMEASNVEARIEALEQVFAERPTPAEVERRDRA